MITVVECSKKPRNQTKQAVQSQVRGVHVLGQVGDVFNGELFKLASWSVAEDFGKIDALIVNASYPTHLKPVATADLADWCGEAPD